jgi:ethanolamine ammonia-lyase small subunit
MSAERLWSDLRRRTPSRIGLARSGDALSTREVLELRAAHAAARDAVHTPLDTAALAAELQALRLESPVVVATCARDRAQYLRRPDLGRLPEDLSALTRRNTPTGCSDPREIQSIPETAGRADLAVVLADGLSARAVQQHAAGVLAALLPRLDADVTVAAPVIAVQARVALGDHVAAALGASTVLVLIGERPGLSVADSLGAYLTHRPKPGSTTDAERNCVSNIHPPDGLDYDTTATVLAGLVAGARRLGRSGVALKAVDAPPTGTLSGCCTTPFKTIPSP